MFKKGNPGRPLGAKGKEELVSLKNLLKDAFVRNRSAAIAKIDLMFTSEDLKDFKWLCEIKAIFEPKDAQIVIDNSVHTHITSVEVQKMPAEQLVDFIAGRNNGRINTIESKI